MRRKHSSDRVLSYIKDFIELYGYGPTVRRIGDDLDISSTSMVAHILDELERDGKIKRTAREARTIVVVGE